ncbi:MAG TPA: phage holin, partial [Lachnospiraceae bacterium]|nr:phage holin [Lachnospiraceae bacterium]
MNNNINWKVRINNGSWWLSVISAIVIAIFSILRLCGVETSVSEKEILDVITLILMVPATIGIITDPTTKGISDSQRAMSYNQP